MTSGNIKFSKLDPGTHMYAHVITGRQHCLASNTSPLPALDAPCSPPHCGPSNQRIRMHLGPCRPPITTHFPFVYRTTSGLEVPDGAVLSIAGTAAAALGFTHPYTQTQPLMSSAPSSGEQRRWRQGEVIVFDDSFEHEVWHNGTRLARCCCCCCCAHIGRVYACGFLRHCTRKVAFKQRG
jgi:hypothetical protein